MSGPAVAAPRAYGAGADSFLLLEAVLARPLAGRRVLELCCGRGLVALACAGQGARVTAADVWPEALDYVRQRSTELALPVSCVCSDLFRELPGVFDLIAVNPPYLVSPPLAPPAERLARPGELACLGGAQGREIIDRILEGLPGHLAPGTDSRCLLLVSEDNGVASLLEQAAGLGLVGRVVARHDVADAERLRVLELGRRPTGWRRWLPG